MIETLKKFNSVFNKKRQHHHHNLKKSNQLTFLTVSSTALFLVAHSNQAQNPTFRRPVTLSRNIKNVFSLPFHSQKYGETCGKLDLPEAQFQDYLYQINDEFRIVGGHDVGTEYHPWQVYFQAGMTETIKFQCGGSIISDKYIITAAHCCMWGVAEKFSGIIHGLTKILEPIPVENYKDVKKITSHPGYDAIKKQHDIALVEITQRLEFNRYTAPICLPHAGFCLNSGKTLTATGWGATSEGGQTSVHLQAVNLPLNSNSHCKDVHDPLPIFQGMVCAGGEAGKDACQGDSGGPLIFRDANGVNVLVGVTSWGIGCARPDLPGVYTRVANYLDWIYENSLVENDGESTSDLSCLDDKIDIGEKAILPLSQLTFLDQNTSTEK